MSEENSEQTFPLGTILSVMHQRMLAPQGFPSVSLLLTHLIASPHFIGQIVVTEGGWRECSEELRRQLPHLTGALRCGSRCGCFSVTTTRDWARIDALEQQYGPVHPVRPMARAD